MTFEEFEEKYSSVVLKFNYYYKYVFYYTGIAEDDTRITCGWGGSVDDIYNYHVSNDDTTVVGYLRAEWNYCVACKNGKEIFSFYDY